MASGHNDPKLLYAVSGVKAYHIANGDEQSLTPSGPQTLSLLMVPTSSGFADPSGLTSGNGEEDFYLHLHLPPELDLPMPATTQIYHQPPSSYLIPRWDLGPGSGAFTRLEFPAPNSRAGVQEDVDTFETILAQCTAFLERAPPPRPPRSKAAEAKAREAAGEAPPPYNPASFEAGEAYVQGSASSHVGGRIVLVDEEDGSVIGELSEGFKVVEDSAVRPGTKDPVEITLPEDGSHNISVEPAEYDYIEDSVHPAYKKSTLVSGATRASRLLITTSDYVGKMLQGQADSFTHKTEPVANPVTFTPATHERIRRINQYSSKAAGLSSSTVGSISKVTQNLASNIRRKDGKARGYDKDGNMVESYKPGILNKSLMAFNTIVDGAEQAGKTLLNSTSNSVSTVVGHRWGPDAGEAARNIGGGFKNVGLVYIDVTGVSRRAILKSVAKGMLVGQVKDGGKVYVGGDDGASVSGANGPGKAAATAAYGDSKGKKPSNAGAVPDLAPPNGISVIGDPTVTLSILKMLHEILLSLSGHPSPLLTAELDGTTQSSSALSPSERQLLATAAHLSDLHSKLIKHAARITASHPSTVCRAVATAIQSVHLAALRRTVLEVEAGILRHDPDLVGAYNIVPLTAVIGAFQPWTRRLEWLWEVVQFVEAKDASGRLCWGARAIDRLRAELQSGYRDVEETALTLVAAAETAWLRQVSAWIFYGRLPSAAGSEDFFIRSSSSRSGGRGAEDIPQDEDYVSVAGLLPAFVTPATAKSMLFIGRSLNQIRARSTTLSTASGFHNTAAKLQAIANLTSPLNSANFTGTIRDIRQSLSQDILEQILPLAEVVSTMQLLREFFLLGRGEFAMALTQEADERIRGRWRRAGHLAHDKDSGVQNVTVKSGEVSAALARAWASLSSFERADDGDELLDRARDSLRLQLVKARPDMPAHAHAHARPGLSEAAVARLAASPFSSLLFSVPVTLAVQLPPAVDMVLSASDMQLYSGAHAYLMALRRAHIRLTDLWKLTSLRRHYPGPRGADAHAQELRQRWSARAEVLRGMWTTASAAIFFLGETEAYFQTEVVAGLWRGFQAWLTGDDARHNQTQDVVATADEMDISDDDIDDQDLFPATAPPTRPTTSSSSAAVIPRKNRHDQQTLATGHTVYLDTLVHRLLLTHDAYTRPLYALLVHIDHLVTHVHRLHSLFTSIDLETDAGVVDAFANLAAEEAQVLRQLRAVARSVRAAIDDVVAALEALSVDEAFLQVWEGEGGGEAAAAVAQMDDWAPGEAYRPERVGGLNRLLMQLKFGS